MYNIGICDDGENICTSIEKMIQQYAKKQNIQIETNVWYTGEGVRDYLAAGNHLDILFLDIELFKMTRIEARFNKKRQKINIFIKITLTAVLIFDIVVYIESFFVYFYERTNGMDKENLKPAPEIPESAVQHEDVALKTAFRYFSDVLLPYFGITKKAVGIEATELVHLDVKKFHEDFNFVMEDSSWVHFEFQSTNEGLDGLKRFRVYEAVASYQNKVAITTYVLFSGKIKKPMAEFTEGVNTFRIVPVIMQNSNADQLIAELKRKQKCGEELTKEDLVPLTLCLLMGGEMSLRDRVKAAYQITQEAVSVGQEELDKIETVLYVMADKFLDAIEMNELMEVIGMTQLGQKLVRRGIEQGIEQGLERGLEQGLERGKEEGKKEGKEEERLEIAQNLIGLLDVQIIAERTGLSLETVLKLSEQQAAVSAL